MKTQHTAGPWETSTNSEGEWDVCAPGAGDMLADLRLCPNAEANAHLIAAAPDLLDSCDYVDSVAPVGPIEADDLIVVTITGKGLRDLRAAIAKARLTVPSR